MTRATSQEIRIPTGHGELRGTLLLPVELRGLVVLALRSVNSERALSLVGHLRARGFGTLLVPLLTPEEEEVDAQTAELRFNVRLLGERILAQIAAIEPFLNRRVELGILASSTAAAGALVAAARRPEAVRALVLQGGRPELAVFALPEVLAPTLLLVGSADEPTIHSNQIAALRLHAPHRLAMIDGANHRFQEPGKLEEAADVASAWFLEHLHHPGSTPPERADIAPPSGEKDCGEISLTPSHAASVRTSEA